LHNDPFIWPFLSFILVNERILRISNEFDLVDLSAIDKNIKIGPFDKFKPRGFKAREYTAIEQ